MAQVTLRIIDGADRGHCYRDLKPPVTIGREEGNVIQLNDDRVSRFHLKIQEDRDRLVLTDLASTNGTLVNGEKTDLRILRYGDLITIGRTMIRFGSPEEIAGRLARLREKIPDISSIEPEEIAEELEKGLSLDFELNWSKDPELQTTLHTIEPPLLPERLDAVQAAQLSELIEFLHIRLRHLLLTVSAKADDEIVTLDLRQWQNLVDLQSRLAGYLREIGEQERDPWNS